MKLGRTLGRGGFCVVSEVVNITLRKDKDNEESNTAVNQHAHVHDYDGVHDYDDMYQHIIQDRQFMEAHCLRGSTKDCRYAIKKLHDSCYNDSSTFINGVVDLAIEARYLSVIRHSNIIKMRAMSSYSPMDSRFFVVLDKLYDILTPRLIKWKKAKPIGLKKLMDVGGKKALSAWVERCTFGYDLACALKYLHNNQ